MVQTGSVSVDVEIDADIQTQCEKRLINLYSESHEWLLKAAYNFTKSYEDSEDLVSELYLYLSKKCNPNIFWGSSYNLLYLHQFLKHRWYNKVPIVKRYVSLSNTTVPNFVQQPYEEYDIEQDEAIMKAHQQVVDELKRLQTTKLWAKGRIFEMYWMSDDTLNEVANKIGISSSTTFIAIKRIRQYLAKTIENPFNNK